MPRAAERSPARWHRPARIAVGGLILGALVAHLAGAGALLGSPDRPNGAVPISQEVGDSVAGNGRPTVITYGGLMIRRCQAVLLYEKVVGSAETLRRELHAAAKLDGLSLTDLPADVLSPATLERPAPEVVACLQSADGAPAARRLLAARLPGVRLRGTESVLVHSLTFSLRPAHLTPQRLAAAIDRDGILTDTLGTYGLRVADPSGRLMVSYTGPLLSDREIDEVRAAIARPDQASSALVGVAPASTAGPPIDLATEPPPAQAVEVQPSERHH
jgi:hypothetical protein